MRKWLTVLGLLVAARGAVGQTPDPREHNFTFSVDGTTIGGVVGYRIGFTRNPTARADSRRLDLTYSPDQRLLVITVSEKGLAQLQNWLNSATDTQAPLAHTITIIARDNAGVLLAQWELTGATPLTFTSAAAGTINTVDSTIEFLYDKLRLVQAKAK
ncbi:MAG: hypothetical protein ACRD00_06970 [Thermoanaerobaculia bacterium]